MNDGGVLLWFYGSYSITVFLFSKKDIRPCIVRWCLDEANTSLEDLVRPTQSEISTSTALERVVPARAILTPKIDI